MPTSLVDADSILALDIGTVSTRALLFDVVDGRYRFIAAGTGPTTAGAPYANIGEGIHIALEQLQEITGREILDANGHLILPSQDNGSGVDVCVSTLSVGKPLRVVSVGLLEDVSTESAQRLATTTYAQVVDRFSLNDRRKGAVRLDAILRARPDLIIVAGGTEGGASQSVMGLIESVGLACFLIPEAYRPEILYAGNKELVPQIEEAFESVSPVAVAPNVRPALDVEQLAPAQNQIARVFRSVRSRSIGGVQDLELISSGNLQPTATAFGRIIRFLSKVYDPAKGVLGIDIGAAALTAAASFAGDLYMGVYTDLGMGERVDSLRSSSSGENITRWLPFDMAEEDLLDYVYNKKLHPGAVPSTAEELALEHALAREALAAAVRRLSRSFPRSAARSLPGLLPWFEPIVGAGSVLTRAPSRAQSLMMLLDGLQPVGVTTLVLDQNNLIPALGAAAPVNSLLPIQMLETNTFLNLGSVITVISSAPPGAPVLKVRVKYAGGNEAQVEVKNGSLEVISLAQGEVAQLQLQPLNRAEVGMGGAGRGGSVKVTGGAAGVVIDARGRPLRLPKDPGKRREQLKKWLWNLEG